MRCTALTSIMAESLKLLVVIILTPRSWPLGVLELFIFVFALVDCIKMVKI